MKTEPNVSKVKKAIIMSDRYNGVDRRINESGRRTGDTCSQHCALVRQWEEKISELKNDHKDDQKETNARLKGSAPLWTVLVLITLVAGSVAYTFQTSANMHRDMADRMGTSNAAIQLSLFEIKKDLEIAKSRQADIRVLIEKHMSKLESERTQK